MPNDPVDLSAVRWASGESAQGLPPADALRAALRAIEAGELNPDHVIVCVGVVEERDTIGTRVFSSGKFDLFGAMGLLSRSAQIIGFG